MLTSIKPDLQPRRPDMLRVALITLSFNALASLAFTVISIATPYIGRALGAAGQDELWLTDAFLIALICVTPISGHLASRLGVKPLLLWSAAGATGFFTLCVFIPDVPSLTVLCFLVGAFSGFMTPTTQALIVSVYPSEKRGTAMAIWGAGTMVGILLGAAFTGMLLEQAPWQFVFYLSLPLGLTSFLIALALRHTSETRSDEGLQTDWLEVSLLITVILSFGVFINLGDDLNWFHSRVIVFVATLFACSLPVYFWYVRKRSSNIVNLAVFRDRSFATVAVLTFGTAFFSTGQFEIDLLGGPLALSSELLSLRSSLGAAALLMGVVLGGRLLRRNRPPLLIIVALAITLIGKYGFTKYGYAMSVIEVVWPQVVSGFGLGLLATPLAVAAYETLAASQTKDASSLFVLSTQLGSALGIAVLGVALVYLRGIEVGDLGLSSVASSTLEPFLDVFWLEFFGTAVFVPVALLLRPRKTKRAAAE